jgi:hypothetical protein
MFGELTLYRMHSNSLYRITIRGLFAAILQTLYLP